MIAWFTFENIRYMIALLIGISIHIWRSEKRDHFIIRLAFALLGCILLSVFSPVFSEKYALLNYVVHLVLFVCVVVASKICFRLSWFYTMNRCNFGLLTYCCGYVWGILIIELFSISPQYRLIIQIGTFVLVYLIFFLLSFRENRAEASHFNDKFKMLITNFLAVISLAIVGMKPLSENARTFEYLIIIYLVFWLLNIFSEEKRIQDDYKIVKQLLAKEEQQYEMSKEYIDLINVKCHDLKHQIVCLKEGNVDYEYLKEMETIINNFDADIKTGNEALNVVLTEKSRYCMQKEIEFTCIADGRKMDFITQADIYSLIGNILDNAIESVENVSEKEKKFISMKIREEAGVLHIRSENYIGHELIMENGSPLTTKEDKNMHGFGIKSIQIIAKKYKGVANFFTRNHIFILDVLIPFQTR